MTTAKFTKYGDSFSIVYTSNDQLPKTVRFWKGKAGRRWGKYHQKSHGFKIASKIKIGEEFGGCDGKNHKVVKITMIYSSSNSSNYQSDRVVGRSYYLDDIELLGDDGTVHYASGNGCVDVKDWWLLPEWQEQESDNSNA